MTVAPAETVAAHLAMFESSWFGQGPAFWRWVVTAEAEPYVAAFIERPRMPQPGERLYLMSEVDESQSILDTTDFDQLADDIEARYDTPDPAG